MVSCWADRGFSCHPSPCPVPSPRGCPGPVLTLLRGNPPGGHEGRERERCPRVPLDPLTCLLPFAVLCSDLSPESTISVLPDFLLLIPSFAIYVSFSSASTERCLCDFACASVRVKTSCAVLNYTKWLAHPLWGPRERGRGQRSLGI